MFIVANELVMLRAGFSRDNVSNLMHQIGVPCGRQTNRLWEHSCVAGARHPMQRFVPPFIRGNAQTFDSWRRIHHLRNFFFKRHA